MTLPASGAISMSQVSVELGRASSASTSLGETAVRNLAGVSSGAISMSNLHGKSSVDYVPNSFNVTDIYEAGSFGSNYGQGESNTVTISGINQPINILFEFTSVNLVVGLGQSGYAQIQVIKNTSISAVSKTYSGSGTKADSSDTVSFANGDTFKIFAEYTVTGGTLGENNGDLYATVNMKNASSGNALLDTMTITVTVNEGGV